MSQDQKQRRPSAVFASSAANIRDIPQSSEREFCVFGRSNVGKSSFINHVFSNGSLARVSKTPGKTTLANFYKVDDGSVWVDLPGYGHAQKARSEQVRWSRLVADYCEKRENLCGVILLCDSRHPGLSLDKEALAWLSSLSLPVLVVLTKTDKLSPQERAQNLALFVRTLRLKEPPVPYSTRYEEARKRFWEHYEAWASRLQR
ncbi:MAG TPA: ribosome biogenesis GTP-binding protein YihA/YsxC [Chitinivibrionales bacterium]|jgi:GTP-binding protein|nr:ribosome biogenesis GTP-binding protein YihA/YsxC [Chitinivibrionales bacterium]